MQYLHALLTNGVLIRSPVVSAVNVSLVQPLLGGLYRDDLPLIPRKLPLSSNGTLTPADNANSAAARTDYSSRAGTFPH